MQNTVQEAHDQCRFRQTFWQVRRIPPVWEWQAIQVLVSLPSYGRDSPTTSESIVGRQLGTICFSNKEHDSMVLCISELCKIFILLSIRNVSPWKGESRCFSVFEVRWLLRRVQIGSMNTFGRITVNQSWQEPEQRHWNTWWHKGVQLEAKTGNKYYLIAEYRSILCDILRTCFTWVPQWMSRMLLFKIMQTIYLYVPYKCSKWS